MTIGMKSKEPLKAAASVAFDQKVCQAKVVAWLITGARRDQTVTRRGSKVSFFDPVASVKTFIPLQD